MHTRNGLVVDIALPRTDWLEELRYDKRWLIDSRTAVTEHMQLHGRDYIMSARYAAHYYIAGSTM
jgi:hypothetical protein